jgi:hypothetical protein
MSRAWISACDPNRSSSFLGDPVDPSTFGAGANPDTDRQMPEAEKSFIDAARRVAPTVLPIGMRQDGRRVEAKGTGFLLNVAGLQVLVTATHVLTDSVGPRYLFGPRAEVRLRDARVIRVDSDPAPALDLAFLVPPLEDLTQIGAVKALPFDADVGVPPFGPSAGVTCFGLPVSHTRQRGAHTPLHGSMTVLTGPVLDPAGILATRYHPDTHFVFDYNIEATPHEDGTVRRGRQLFGMSGGPVFLPEAWLINGKPFTFLHLVGALVGGSGLQSAPTATRIGALAAAFVQHGIATPQQLPQGALAGAPNSLRIESLDLA